MGNEGGDAPRSNSLGGLKVTTGPVFLHGQLDLWIVEAKSLPNMDLISERVRQCCSMFGPGCRPPFVKRKVGRSGKNSMITSDPYVSVCLAGATVARTRVISNCENPLWDEHFWVPVAHPVVKVEFNVKDNDVFGAELIGVVEIPVTKIISGDEINDWFPILGNFGSPLKPYPELHISIQFRPVSKNPLYKDGVGVGPDHVGVPNTYFPLRKGGHVTLYQDAHVPDEMVPQILLDDGRIYEQAKCWEDICHAILEAHHLIYIIGWSVYHPVKLVREPTRPLPQGGELSLGELLKYKSEEGVRVNMLIWDDKTSHDNFLLKTDGVMQTHDEATKKFFRHSSVHCALAPRYASTKLSIFKQQVVGTLYTHHQKCVILDTQASGNNRKITAFIGGLDLCDGRYDTPEHRLYRDLDTAFKDDFHNPTFTSTTNVPRQPWHDLHCKVEGPAAYDILKNFEQRWKKVMNSKLKHWHEDSLLKLDRISFILSPSTEPDIGDKVVRVKDENDPENWHVQVFRSIDSGSVKGFPKSVEEAEKQNLVCAKNLKVDKSIHTAYVKAIRSAQHFIYIENQYFVGSSFYWPSYKNAGANNLIPMELALKIASKISANERFSVYVVIPMWPEGVPSSAAVQEILFWQVQTMEMMYGIVAQALQKAGLSPKHHPLDYLNFYCLAKREPPSPPSTSSPSSSPSLAPLSSQRTQPGHKPTPSTSENSSSSKAQALVQKSRRFMIYVHAKGMIVDDEYVIMGSANINQRSLDGSRDTEIAMGSYQPRYTWAAKKGHPRGQVYGYRMSLWAEHMGELEDSFREPQTLECVKRVNKLAKHNWKAYVNDDPNFLTNSDDQTSRMKGHLVPYPVKVSREGKVTALPGLETFPDVGGKILGSPTTLPDALTT